MEVMLLAAIQDNALVVALVGVAAILAALTTIQKFVVGQTWLVGMWRTFKRGWEAAVTQPRAERQAEIIRRAIRDETGPQHDLIKESLRSLANDLSDMRHYQQYHLGPNTTAPPLYSTIVAAATGVQEVVAMQRGLLDANPQAIMEANSEQQTVAANKAAQIMLGAESEEEMLDQRWRRFLSTKSLHQIDGPYALMAEIGKPVEWPYVEVIDPSTRDTESPENEVVTRTFRSKAWAVPNPDPDTQNDKPYIAFIGAMEMLSDKNGGHGVSQLDRIEAKLDENASFVEIAMDTNPVAMWKSGYDHRPVKVNQAYLDIFNFHSFDQAMTDEWMVQVPESFRPVVIERLEKIASTKVDEFHYEFPVGHDVHGPGGWKWYRISGYPVEHPSDPTQWKYQGYTVPIDEPSTWPGKDQWVDGAPPMPPETPLMGCI